VGCLSHLGPGLAAFAWKALACLTLSIGKLVVSFGYLLGNSLPLLFTFMSLRQISEVFKVVVRRLLLMSKTSYLLIVR
jgi:hypothetical protein